MHIRVRNNVAQLIRTTYDAGSKKGKSAIIGKVKLAHPELDEETRKALTADELAEFEQWSNQQQRAVLIAEELSALQLGETMNEASRWFAREGDTIAARAAAASIMANWQTLRRALKKSGMTD